MLAQMFAMALRGSFNRVAHLITANDTSDEVTSPASAQVLLTFKNDGTIAVTTSGGTTTASWMTGSTNGALYDLYVNAPSAGSFSTGTTGVALNLASNQSFTVTRNSIGNKACTALYEIRPAGSGTILTSKTLTLTADVSA